MQGILIGLFEPLWARAAAAVFVFVWLYELVIVLRGGDSLARRLDGLRGDVSASYRRRLQAGLDRISTFFGDAHTAGPYVFSAQSYIFTFGLAVFYPFAFMTLAWAFLGGSGSLGDLAIWKDAMSTGGRAASGAAYLIGVAGIVWASKFQRSRGFGSLLWFLLYAAFYYFASWVGSEAGYSIGVAVAAVFVVAVVAFIGDLRIVGMAAAVFSIFAALIASRTSAAPLIADAGLGGVMGFLAFVVVLLVTLALLPWLSARNDTLRKGWRLVPLFSFAPLVFLGLAAFFDPLITWLDLDKQYHASTKILIFFTLLPTINALFDWVSLAVSRKLIGQLADESDSPLERLARLPIVGGVADILVIVVDLVIGLVLAVLIVVATAGGVALFSRMNEIGGGAGFYSVSSIVDEVATDPGNPHFWWIYASMFWTLGCRLKSGTTF